MIGKDDILLSYEALPSYVYYIGCVFSEIHFIVLSREGFLDKYGYPDAIF